MLSKHRGILLQTIRYSDHSVILKLFTEQEGLQSFVFRKSSKQKSAGILQPLSILEIEAWKKPQTDLYSVRELRTAYSYKTIGNDYLKNSVVLFLNEILLQVIKEPGHALEEMNHFITSWLILFDNEERAGEKHLFFLAELCNYLGIHPVNNYSSERKYFDVSSAQFVSFSNGNQLTFNEEDSLLFHRILFEREDLRLTREQKKNMADSFVLYYQVHLPGVKEIKSLPVLKEILD